LNDGNFFLRRFTRIFKISFSSIRLLPHHQDTGAFFVALFRKIDSSSSSSSQEEISLKRPAEDNTFNEDGYII